jgi:hypothetical protein
LAELGVDGILICADDVELAHTDIHKIINTRGKKEVFLAYFFDCAGWKDELETAKDPSQDRWHLQELPKE